MLKYWSIILLPCTLLLPSVSPAPNKPKGEEFITSFDTLTDGKQPPTPTDGLQFSGFIVRPDSLSLVRSPSPPYHIVASQLSNVLNNAPPQNITSDYPSSNVESFALESLYLACILPGTKTVTGAVPTLPVVGDLPVVQDPPVALGVPLSCSVTFEGLDKAGKLVPRAEKVCKYDISTKYQKCDFKGAGFPEVKTVRLSRVDAKLAPGDVLSVLVDDVVHVNYPK